MMIRTAARIMARPPMAAPVAMPVIGNDDEDDEVDGVGEGDGGGTTRKSLVEYTFALTN